MFKSLSLALAVAATPVSALAGVVVDVEEVDGNVVMSASGTLDLSAWSFAYPGLTSANVSRHLFVVGPADTIHDVYESPAGYAAPDNLQPNFLFHLADFGSGDLFGLAGIADEALLEVPSNYSSGSPLQGSATYLDTTVAGLDLLPGEFTWTWASPTTGGSDFFTVRITAVPEPTSVGLLAAGSILALTRRR